MSIGSKKPDVRALLLICEADLFMPTISIAERMSPMAGKWIPVLASVVVSFAGSSSWSLASTFDDDFEPWGTVEGRDGRFYGLLSVT